MYIATVPNRTSPPAILLRESYREGTKVKSRTLANLSSLTPGQVEGMRRVLRGEELFAADGPVRKIRDRSHGAVDAVRQVMVKLGIETLLERRSCRERDLVVAMLVARITEAESKLATTRTWQTTTLPEDLEISDATEDDLYEAMDWLLERQGAIEKRLASRHLRKQGLVLYDLSSSYFEGQCCPLAKLGYNRDGKKGKLQVNYGLLTDERGCPVAVRVYEGNASDSTTLIDQVERVQRDFAIDGFVIVGDRGMITETQIKSLREKNGVAWVTALKSGRIRSLIQSGALQLGLFDDRNLFSVQDAKFANERFIACKNHDLARLRAHKRQSLLEATRKELEVVQRMVGRGKLVGKAAIGVRVGKVINKHKVAKHFLLDIGDSNFSYRIREDRVAEEAALDGLYVIRTSLTKDVATDEQAVRHYKKLANVERAFRSIKTIDLKVRPIHHHLESRVRAHIFLCTLAFYVEWHMREAWRTVLFSDEDQTAKETRDPVAPAKRSKAALEKVAATRLDDGTPVHSFRTLLADLATITRSTFAPDGANDDRHTFTMTTLPSPEQARALQLLETIAV
jgi:transposase